MEDCSTNPDVHGMERAYRGKELYQSFSFSDPYFGYRFVPGARAVGRGSWRREVELSDSEDESQVQL